MDNAKAPRLLSCSANSQAMLNYCMTSTIVCPEPLYAKLLYDRYLPHTSTKCKVLHYWNVIGVVLMVAGNALVIHVFGATAHLSWLVCSSRP